MKMSDKQVIAIMLKALKKAYDPLYLGSYYQGDVLDVAATVREAIEVGSLAKERS
jgi:hypothetical protein